MRSFSSWAVLTDEPIEVCFWCFCCFFEVMIAVDILSGAATWTGDENPMREKVWMRGRPMYLRCRTEGSTMLLWLREAERSCGDRKSWLFFREGPD